MAFKAQNEGIAASIFLALYVVYTFWTTVILIKEGWKTQYTFLFIFGLLRVGGQLCGVMFSALGWEHWQWLIAYIVLTAEGYFTLVLSSFHFLAKAQVKVYGKSWIRPTPEQIKEHTEGMSFSQKRHYRMTTPSALFHLVLIPANAILIAGGSMLSGMTQDQLANDHSKVTTSKALRTVGQAIFLTQTLFVVFLSIYLYFKEKLKVATLYLLFLSFPFLIVRGIFGILSIYITKMNYFQITNYVEGGLSNYFVACEYTMATTMEFVVAVLLLMNYYYEKASNRWAARKLRDDETKISPENSK